MPRQHAQGRHLPHHPLEAGGLNLRGGGSAEELSSAWDSHLYDTFTELESILDTQVYFATPHHAWERGTNENTNGLIRQYLPKGTNLNRLTQRQCSRIAEQLNNRPRLRLGFKTPNEVYY